MERKREREEGGKKLEFFKKDRQTKESTFHRCTGTDCTSARAIRGDVATVPLYAARRTMPWREPGGWKEKKRLSTRFGKVCELIFAGGTR